MPIAFEVKRLTQAIRRLLAARGQGKSICPSEAARAVDPERWRELMGTAREVAATLAENGEVIVTQRGRVVDARAVRGPIRIARVEPASSAARQRAGKRRDRRAEAAPFARKLARKRGAD